MHVPPGIPPGGSFAALPTSLSSSSSRLIPPPSPSPEAGLHPVLGTLHSNLAPVHDRRFTLPEMVAETQVLVKYAIPIIGTHLLENTIPLVSVISVGHLGTIELAAASLANITTNCAAFSLIIGFVSALDTLCPQAYTSSHPEQTSLYAIRTLILLVLFLIPEILIFWNSKSLFVLLGQDPDLSEKASQYLKIFCFGLPGISLFEVTRRWLQAQGLMLPSTVIVLSVAPLNALLSYLLVYGPRSTRLGFVGAPMATVISFNLMGVLSTCYCVFVAPKTAWGGFTRSAFKDLGTNFRFGLSGFTMIASEWWCWEIIGLACSFLGPTPLAAQSVITTISTLLYQFPYATSAASSVRIGNLIGLDQLSRSRVSAYSSFVVGCMIGVFNVFIMSIFAKFLGGLFSSEADVLKIVDDLTPLFALFQVPDGLTAVLGGILRGVGKPQIGAIIIGICYYLIGLPIGLFLCFYPSIHLGVSGLWIGMTIGVSITVVVCAAVILKLDFEKIGDLSRERMQKVHQKVLADEEGEREQERVRVRDEDEEEEDEEQGEDREDGRSNRRNGSYLSLGHPTAARPRVATRRPKDLGQTENWERRKLLASHGDNVGEEETASSADHHQTQRISARTTSTENFSQQLYGSVHQ